MKKNTNFYEDIHFCIDKNKQFYYIHFKSELTITSMCS